MIGKLCEKQYRAYTVSSYIHKSLQIFEDINTSKLRIEK